MNNEEYLLKAEKYLKYLCSLKPDRRLGSKGNKMAVDFCSKKMKSFGFDLDKNRFKCIDYFGKKPSLLCGKDSFTVEVSPYSLPCNIESKIILVNTLKELEEINCNNSILLMKDELCKEQLMPKNFDFYNPDEHKKIIALLEKKKPAAIITATKKNPGTAGARYPFPLIEDGDFNIPSV
jgi:aminopeptidase YwaD